jgi:hypothetical protein
MCGNLPQFGWHDLHGYNLYCRECDSDSGDRNTGFFLDKKDAVKTWNRLTSKGKNLADSGKERQPKGENNTSSFQFPKLEEVHKHIQDRVWSGSISDIKFNITNEIYNFIVGNKKR